jgi:hypothetical protein
MPDPTYALFALYAPDFRAHAADGTITGVEETRAVLTSLLDVVPNFAAAPGPCRRRGRLVRDQLHPHRHEHRALQRLSRHRPDRSRCWRSARSTVDGKLTVHWGLIDLATLFAQLQS